MVWRLFPSLMLMATEYGMAYIIFHGDLEYKYEVDNWTHQEDLIDDMQNGASCAPITDYWGTLIE